MAMAVAATGAVEGQRSSKLVAALSRTSAAFLFFSVVVVGAVAVSTRWITTTTTLQVSFPTAAAIPAAAAVLHPETQHPNPSPQSTSTPPRPPPAAYSISCPTPPVRRNISHTTKASKSSQTLALALSSSSSCRSAPDLLPATATAARSPSYSSCPSYFRFIHEDLRPWRAAGGVTRAMLARARATASFRLVVLNGRAFVQRFRPAFQTRDLFTIWGILQLLRRYPGRVPDLDLMFDCVDWPVVRTHLYRGEHAPFMPPLFRYCGDDRTLDIVFPDWSFWGWPEINIKPWDALHKDLKDGNSKVRWFSREPYAYWKGNAAVATSRQELVKCNVSSTQDWNARIYTQDWFKESKEGYKTSNLESQCTHRYKIYIEGSAWSISQKYILACDSMTLLVTPKYYDFFSRSLMPLQHYWPVRNENKCASIQYAVDWGNSHKQLAQRIGKEASDFVQQEVNMDHVYDYMLHLLTEYAKLLKFKPTKPPEAVEVCPESLVCQAEGTQKKFLMESMVKSAYDSGPCDLPPPFNPQELTMLKQRKENSIRQVEMWERRASTTR
ncbi:O-glucosyltransferase rumi homolog isoform X2 [Triticum dicoccoides]|uniref:O-glucosyltransferase rumi homolog isoform X2 n=1 Tax=Triticum dicoccoides TaxID=85692 RepID=UPI00188F476C|nr:O-glucosyltransferase rumi homolog isoform X2 [Triticum dicoccoides]